MKYSLIFFSCLCSLLPAVCLAASCNDAFIEETQLDGYPFAASPAFDQFTTDKLSYDAQNYNVYQRQSHGRQLTVAILKSFALEDVGRRQAADFLFNLWRIYRHEFGGFSFADYTIVIGGPNEFSNSFGNGFNGDDPVITDNYYSHEIYHAWAGSSFSGLEGRMWLTEGSAVYYGLRQQKTNSHEWLMSTYMKWYEQWMRDGEDVVLADMKFGQPGYDHLVVSVKGALVLFKLDRELQKLGTHLGYVMRDLYQRHGTVSHGEVSNADILQSVNRVAKTDFTPFFNKYVFAKERLSLDSLSRVCHEMEQLHKSVLPFIQLLTR